jgi:hypothetical protein
VDAALASCSGISAETELSSRRSFFLRRQLLDAASADGRCCAAAVLPSLRAREPCPREAVGPGRSRPSRAAAARTAERDGGGDDALLARSMLPVPRLPRDRPRGSPRGRRTTSLRGGRHRPRALRVRHALAPRRRCGRACRVLGARRECMADAPPMARRDRRWAAVRVDSRLAAELATTETRRARRDDARVARSSLDVVRSRRQGVRGRGARRLSSSRSSPTARARRRHPPRWADSPPAGP